MMKLWYFYQDAYVDLAMSCLSLYNDTVPCKLLHVFSKTATKEKTYVLAKSLEKDKIRKLKLVQSEICQ